jgi:excisionase family DNA binding protein
MNNDIMTISQAENYLQVCEKTICRLIDRKELTVSKVGNAWRIKKEDIEKYL